MNPGHEDCGLGQRLMRNEQDLLNPGSDFSQVQEVLFTPPAARLLLVLVLSHRLPYGVDRLQGGVVLLPVESGGAVGGALVLLARFGGVGLDGGPVE